LLVEIKALKANGSKSLFVNACAPGAFSRGNGVCRQRHVFSLLRLYQTFRNSDPLKAGLAEAEGSRVIVTWASSFGGSVSELTFERRNGARVWLSKRTKWI
jgi:hypothetical protein